MELLRKSEIFSAMLEDDLGYIATRAGLQVFDSGASVFHAESQADRFFIVRSGVVSVTRRERNGSDLEMARFLSGEVFGDFDFAMSATRDASAHALERSELLVFPMEGLKLEDLAREKPDTVARILLRSLVMVSSRLRSTHRLIAENSPWIRELKRQIYTDPPTGLMSMSFLEEELPRLVRGPSAVILMKPDRFKELNDAYGHGAGDIAMSQISEMLSLAIRELGRGWAVRLRSNETALIIPHCGQEEAQALVEELARGLGQLNLRAIDANIVFRFTGSFSFGMWPQDESDFRRLVEKANTLLLRAWKEGGSRAYRLPSQGSRVKKAVS